MNYSDEFARYVIRSVLTWRSPPGHRWTTESLRDELAREMAKSSGDWPWRVGGVPTVPSPSELERFGRTAMSDCWDGERWSL